jgi:hypothetical protein
MCRLVVVVDGAKRSTLYRCRCPSEPRLYSTAVGSLPIGDGISWYRFGMCSRMRSSEFVHNPALKRQAMLALTGYGRS